MSCTHNEMLTPKDVGVIFQKSYITIIKWLGDRDADGNYKNGSFKNAFKCRQCGKIYIPVDDVESKMEEYRSKMKGV